MIRCGQWRLTACPGGGFYGERRPGGGETNHPVGVYLVTLVNTSVNGWRYAVLMDGSFFEPPRSPRNTNPRVYRLACVAILCSMSCSTFCRSDSCFSSAWMSGSLACSPGSCLL